MKPPKSLPYRIFDHDRLVVLVTYTKGKIDLPPREDFTETLWVERGEDYYALMSPQLRDKTVRIVERNAWQKSPKIRGKE